MINLINIKQCSIKIKNDMKIEEKKNLKRRKGNGIGGRRCEKNKRKRRVWRRREMIW
jgi:hypothetical protein